MPLNKLDNFIKNTEGRILYVSPSDLDATDSITNSGNSLARPFKTIQRALIESARFSYQTGASNDLIERTTILLMPGDHKVDNRPGFSIQSTGGSSYQLINPNGVVQGSDTLNLDLNSKFDLTDPDNILYKFNSVEGGVIVPRGTSIVGLDLRKTKVRPLYVPNPTDVDISPSAIFRITGTCYFWQFSCFDGKGEVYTDPTDLAGSNKSNATFSHHKLTIFEYADGVNVTSTGLTDLQMYYGKLSNAYSESSTRPIDITDRFPSNPEGFEPKRPEFEIVGAFAVDPLEISLIQAGDGTDLSNVVTVVTRKDHKLTTDTPIKISGVSPQAYNISTLVSSVENSKTFTYLLPSFDANLQTPGTSTNGSVIVETDTVSGASPYVFNISMRSVYGMNGMKADGNKATGFRSMVVAQFTGVSLQKDDRAFVKYNEINRSYDAISFTKTDGGALATQSSSTNPATVYHLDPKAIYRRGWENCHITITNDAIMQIVSVFAIGYNKHFTAINGGDASITNSNSNFGQLALVSEGFKKEAFEKDNKAFITNIITPRALTSVKDKIDWVTLDVGLTKSVGINTHLYLFGFDSKDIKPAGITQGFRVGAQENDKLSVIIGTGKTADILMSDASSSSLKKISASTPVDSIFTVGPNTLLNGEKVVIQSGTGDLPENVENNVVYFVITSSTNSIRTDSVSLTGSQIQIASTAADAAVGSPLKIYGGDQISILSRVSEKNVGDLGHPIQFDTSNSNWYVVANANNEIFSTINTLGVAGIGARTEPTFIERINDSRKIDDKIYKLRVVIPKEIKRSKNVENGFIIQESSTTGFGTDVDFTRKSLNDVLKKDNVNGDYEYNRNPRFISHASYSSPDVTIRTEIPHNLKIGDSVIIKNIKDSTNTDAADSSGYNGTHSVTSIVNDMEFKYNPGRNPAATVTNDFNTKDVSLPRFERNNLQSNIYAYRNEKISDYKDGVQDGIFHIYPLNSGNSVPIEFTDSKFGQNVTDLYPQLDRDNPNDNPEASKTFANRFPLGQVTTNDLKKSITRETVDKLMTDVGIGISIASVGALTSGTRLITFTKEHGIKGATSGAITAGNGYTNGTYNNVRIFNDSGLSSWSGVTANVVVSSGSITSAEIVSKGSGISAGDLFFDTSIIGSGNGAAKFTVSANQLSPSTENYVQITGIGTTAGGYFPIEDVPSKSSISIAQTSSDPEIIPFQYAFVAGQSVGIGTAILPSSTAGITTLKSADAHGLAAGNRVQIVTSSGASPYYNYGDYIVKSVVGVTTFSVVGQVKDPITGTLLSESTPNVRVLKHNLSSNDESSDSTDENISTRGTHLFDHEVLYIDSFTTTNKIKVRLPAGIGVTSRFPYGSYIQVDEEIMRISQANETANGEIFVLRGALGTRVETHDNGSLARKIKPIAIELRRPSVLRASGHTFEYLGYGPGNYSTALPQLQTVSLSEKEEFLSQALEKSSGAVVYTGMNDKGDFYIGNQKKSSLTGEETTFDTPVPTITGEDASRLSVVFDEVTVKERLIVEGGASSQILSQFDGPVTFNEETRIKDKLVIEGTLKIENDDAAVSPTDASVVLTGGFGVNKNSQFADNAELIFGKDADLKIYHDTSLNGGSKIDHSGHDDLRFRIGGNQMIFEKISGENFMMMDHTGGHVKLYHNNSTRLQTTVSGVDITGGLNITGITTMVGGGIVPTGGTFKVEDLTSGRVVTVGTGGVLQDSANLTFDGTTLTGTFSGNLTGEASFATNSNTIDVKSESDSDTYHNIVFTRTPLDSTEGEEVDAFLRADQNDGLQFRPSDRELRVDGDIIAFHTSDERLKKNIKKIDDPLAKVISISGYTFDWNEESEKEGSSTGVIAQEVEKLGLPDLVTTRKKTGYKAVDYEKLVPLLIEAIKELNNKVDDLQQQISDK